MKTLLRKSAVIAATFIMFTASVFSTQAQETKLVYNKAYNRSIGITVENATGATYTIKDKKGNTVLEGTVKSDKTFFVPITKLNTGTYQFYVGGYVVREFIIE